jgi:hypothetical protein
VCALCWSVCAIVSCVSQEHVIVCVCVCVCVCVMCVCGSSSSEVGWVSERLKGDEKGCKLVPCHASSLRAYRPLA